MGRDDLCITVPTFFRCPISLDVMKSPVSLCTGVTYDRSSIQRWLDGGNDTCPATMQVLQTKDFVPNHNLQRLIRIWSDSSALTRNRPSDPTRNRPLTQDQARNLIAQIQNPNPNNSNNNLHDSISKLVSFAKDSDQNRKFLTAIDGFSRLLLEILTNSSVTIIGNKINYVEELFVLLDLVLRQHRDRDCMTKSIVEARVRVTPLMILVLKQGSSVASRVAVARVLESVATDSADQSKSFFADEQSDDVVPELIRLMSTTTESDSIAIESALSTLICAAKVKRIRVRLVRLGCVKSLTKLLNSNSGVGVTEKALKLLETLSPCKEGRAEMCRDEAACVAAVVRKMLKVSAVATENAVAVLWSLCCLFREEAAEETVGRSNGATKILLIMQSNCSPEVKQMAGDLLKVFGVNSKSCLWSYDTKTTHIMPF